MSRREGIRIKAWCPLPLHRDLSAAATREGLSMSGFIVRAVQSEIRRTERQAARGAA